MQPTQTNHHLYAASSIKQADGVAWIVTEPTGPLIQYPFKFQQIKDQEVRLKILHTSICHSDIAHIRGHWGKVPYPIAPGHQVVGQITQIGKSVTQFTKGDKVCVSPIRYSDNNCQHCSQGDDNLCHKRIFLYGEYFGGFSTHMQIDAHWVFHVPNGLSLREMPPLLCAGVTVFAPLRRFKKIGAKCAVIGIGGLGHLALQYAWKLGFNVTAFTTKTNAPQQFYRLGASSVSHSTDLASLKAQESKYDVVINTLFITDMQAHLAHQHLTAPNGVYVILGVPASDTRYVIDTDYMSNKNVTVTGSIVGSTESVKDMLDFSAAYGINSINEHYEFGDFPKALERAELQNPRFRVVVHVEDWAKANGFDK